MKPLSEMTDQELAQENKAMAATIAKAQARQHEVSAEVNRRGVERRKLEAAKMLATHFPDLVVKGEGVFSPPAKKPKPEKPK